MQRNLDNEIDFAITQLEMLTTRGEQIHNDFISETNQLMHNWYLLKTEEIIKEKSYINLQIGIPNLAQLKKDIKQLQEQSSKIVNSFLQDKSLWWHLTPFNQSDPYSGHRFTDPFEKAIRLAAGQLALIIEKYKYLSIQEGDHEIWREYDSSGNHHAPNARPIYPYQIDWSEKMKTLIKEYEALRTKSYPIIESINKLKLEKSRNEATDLWNKA